MESEKTSKKEYTFLAQIIAALWMIGWNSAQFIREMKLGIHIDIQDFMISGFAIAGCFAPVYVSIILDKVNEIKNGGNEK